MEDVSNFTNFRAYLVHTCFALASVHTPGLGEQTEWWCCHQLSPDESEKMGCWTEELTRERCCISQQGDAKDTQVPRQDEEAWLIDDLCFDDDHEDVAPEPCHKEQRFHFDGDVITSLRKEAFRVAYLPHWVRRMRKPEEMPMGSTWRVVNVSAGSDWAPPPRVTAVLVTSEDDKHAEMVPVITLDASSRKNAHDHLPSLYMLILDSVSRNRFRQVLPRTYEFLTQMAAAPAQRNTPAPKGTPRVPFSHDPIEFSRYHTVQFGGTLAQMFPAFFGGLVRCHDDAGRVGSTPDRTYNVTGPLRACPAFKLSVLATMRRAGYRLALAASAWGIMGLMRGVQLTHVFPFADSDFDGIDFTCMGSQYYYELLLSWTLQVIEIHRARHFPLFAYVHLIAGHGGSKYLHAMDLTLRNHLLNVLERNPSLTVILASDHGDVNLACDQRSPMLHIIASKSLYRNYPDMPRALHRNSQEVVSAWDFFATLQHFANFSESSISNRAEFGELLKHGVTHLIASPVRLFQEIALIDLRSGFSPRSLLEPLPSGRSCTEAGIVAHHCRVQMPKPLQEIQCETQIAKHRTPLSNSMTPRPLWILLCQFVEIAIIPIIFSHIEKYLGKADPGGMCKRLTFAGLHSLASDGGRHYLRFSAKEGDPQLVFDASYTFVAYTNTLFLSHLVQVTRYRKYESCSPKRVSPEFCACGM